MRQCLLHATGGGRPAGQGSHEPEETGERADPYKPLIDELLRAGVWDGQVIVREIQARGYEGKGTILRDSLDAED